MRKNKPLWTPIASYDLAVLNQAIEQLNLLTLDFDTENNKLDKPEQIAVYQKHIRETTKAYFDYSTYANLYLLKYNPDFQFTPDLVKGQITDLFIPEVRDQYKGTFFEQFVEDLKAQYVSVDKVYIARLPAGTEIKYHIDFNTARTAKVHLPLVTDPDCVWKFKVKGQETVHHFPVEGIAWDVNVSVQHALFHTGTQDRYHLIAEVHTQ